MSQEKNLLFRMIVPAFPAFNVYSRIARQTTALGPVCVATVINRMDGWCVEMIDENNYRKFGPRDNDGWPDHSLLQTIRHAEYAGFYGGLSSTVPRLYELARQYREKGVVTIGGGQHFVGENIRDGLENGLDYIVLGEGENTVPELLMKLASGDDPSMVRGLAYLSEGELVMTGERPEITDFESLPLPDFNLIRYARINLYPVSWVRGCNMHCEFCTVKGAPRPASVERVVRQVIDQVEKNNARHFFIVDDLFGSRRQEALQLCGLLAEYQNAIGIKLDITVQIRLDRGRDTELLTAMREAGITMVCIGYESPIPEELEAMDKRVKPGEMREMTTLFHKAGFLVHGMFIFGYPLPQGTDFTMSIEDRIKHFRAFIKKSRIDTIQVLLPVPLPGTDLTRRLKEHNRILPLKDIGWEYYDGNFPLIKPDPPLTPESLHMAIKKIMGRFYRFRALFAIVANVVVFPAMIFSLWNIKFGWRIWYRSWRNGIIRFGGWIVVRHWKSDFKKSRFSDKLTSAQTERDISKENLDV
jgi:radical SAM superfamily enzyme YgiQ (UPF0313 family)